MAPDDEQSLLAMKIVLFVVVVIVRRRQRLLLVVIKQRLSASMLFICSSLCLSVCLSVAKMQKTLFSQKLSNLELWSLLTTYKKSYIGFSKNPLRDP